MREREHSKIEADKRRRRDADQRKNDFKAVLSMPQGQRIIGALFERGGLMNAMFTGNSETSKKCGARELALSLYEDAMEADADITLKIIKDNRRTS